MWDPQKAWSRETIQAREAEVYTAGETLPKSRPQTGSSGLRTPRPPRLRTWV